MVLDWEFDYNRHPWADARCKRRSVWHYPVSLDEEKKGILVLKCGPLRRWGTKESTMYLLVAAPREVFLLGGSPGEKSSCAF